MIEQQHNNPILLKIWREDNRAFLPEIAYEGTSACFDLKCIEDVIIPANGTAFAKVGLRIIVPNGYYLEFATRSGHGIGKDLRVHPGIIDAGYTGDLSIKIYNLGKEDVTINTGKGCVQVKVHKVPEIDFEEISEDEFKKISDASIRGEKGFGSSDSK